MLKVGKERNLQLVPLHYEFNFKQIALKLQGFPKFTFFVTLVYNFFSNPSN